MSVRPGAPYDDEFMDGGSTIIYEGHDARRAEGLPNPKEIDQPRRTSSGTLTENGLFLERAQSYTEGTEPPRAVRVYGKLKKGIWAYNGRFHLTDGWERKSRGRMVFKFKLELDAAAEDQPTTPGTSDVESTRGIPSHVMIEVWKRDQGRCVKCGAEDNIHFDHIIPFSKGGTSVYPVNIQILCVRHNLEKGARIE